jgi:hypothetical protein
MFARSELNEWLRGFLADHIDGRLRSANFDRKPSSRSARRLADFGSQQIEFTVFSRPAYARDQAHLSLDVCFHMPSGMDLARRIFGPGLVGTTADTSLACRIALDSLREGPLSLWLFQSRAGLDDLAPQVERSLAAWVLPFLDHSRSEAAFVAGPAREHAQACVVAAAYVDLGRGSDAVDYLRSRRDNPTDAENALLTTEVLAARHARHADALARLENYLASGAIDS